MATAIPDPCVLLRSDLDRVLAGELVPEIWFQPIADLRRGVVAGYEALVRLPVHGAPPPNVWLQIAARYGQQIAIEAIVCRAALKTRRALPRNTFLSINVSPAFLCSPAWDTLMDEQTALSGVVFEITESELIEDYARIRSRIAGLSALGALVAIDDAGAGYASLRHILELKPNFIKLDRALVQNCHIDRAKSTMIEVLGAAADRLDAWVVTEGVETAEEMRELIRLGVPLGQGYFLGRAASGMEQIAPEARQIIEALARHRAKEDNLMLYAEPCVAAADRAQAAAMLQHEGDLAAVVDQWQRPVELLERRGGADVRLLSGFMRTHTSCDLREVLKRALTRPPRIRFHPVLLVDDEGRLQAALRLDQLMLAAMELS